MERPAAIEVAHLAKRFATGFAGARRLGAHSIANELAGRAPSARPELQDSEFWALDDISFAVSPGKALGVVGNNGAGKTTLLRLLRGIIAPDWGRITIRGRVTAIIEPGTAFDGWSTGREAIWSEGAILGLKPARIREIEEEVIEFAELSDVIDAPIRTYSTGMRMRLGYAVAAHTDPDVLLIDEVLAVGDAAFQRKCMSFILEFLDRGGSLVLVSHSIWQLRSVCSRCLVLDHGREITLSDTPDALRRYVESVSINETAAERDPAEAASSGDGDAAAQVAVRSVTVRAHDGGEPRSGSPAVLEIETDVADHTEHAATFVVAIGPMDVPVTALVIESPPGDVLLRPGPNRVRCEIAAFDLIGSTYEISVLVLDEQGETLGSAGLDAPLTFRVDDPTDQDQSPHRIAGSLSMVRPTWG